MVVELDKMAYDKIRQLIKEKVRHIESCFVELAKLLTFVKERELYKEWGYDTFADYVEMDLSLPKHKAQYLLGFCSAMKKLSLTDQDIKELGLEKVKTLASLADKVDQNKIEQLKLEAKTQPVSIVERKVRKLKNTLPEVDIKTEELISELFKTDEEAVVKCTLLLFESVYDLFEATVLRAQEICQTDSKNVAIDYICQVFNATVTKGGQIQDLIAIVKQLERVFKVKISITKGNEKLY